MCKQHYNKFRDGLGTPIFQKDNGDPQWTGWTGYDCNTPICVQAERWVPNTVPETLELVASVNDGTSFQAGCVNETRYTPANRTRTSDSNLCGVVNWWQGVYLDSWSNGLTVRPLSIDAPGRYIKSNFDNYIRPSQKNYSRVAGPLVTGEGIFACYNLGSCVAPDTCECPDGWAGYDCASPLCRHTNVFGDVVGCLNLGTCGFRDRCTCAKQPSLLHKVHPDMPVVQTGYMGSDCAIAMCVQGSFDATCRDVPGGNGSVSSGGEGCYRCPNGGNCTAPDYCTCPPEWSGFDCTTPVCTKFATLSLTSQLHTVDASKVAAFELDPCGTSIVELWHGYLIGRGNCTAPDTCTCFCRDRAWLNSNGDLVKRPWTDPLPWLGLGIPSAYIFGTASCLDGWQGFPRVHKPNYYDTCHLQIFVPSYLRRNLLMISGIIIGSIVLVVVCWLIIRRRMRQRYLLAKAERRRSRRSSEEERSRSQHE